MSAVASLAATFFAGVLSSASPCVLAAVPVTVGLVGSNTRSAGEAVRLSLAFVGGMTLTFTTLGMMAARLGLFIGIVDPIWGILVGVVIAGLGVLLFVNKQGVGVSLPYRWQQRLARSGWLGVVLLGALVGTVMSPCATPALAAALAIAGAGALTDNSVWLGGGLLLAYGLGHSLLLFVAGIAPAQVQQLLIARLDGLQLWLPGRRVFALITALAGGWIAVSNVIAL
jgi:cytochrome c biogenesis protein CcdA